MEIKDGIQTYYPANQAEWRKWLEENHRTAKSVWLIFYHKSSSTPSIDYNEAVDEALCFGWIDSKPNKRDNESYYRFFSRRNPKSKWSQVNKEKVKKLLAEKRMAEAGVEMVVTAKQNGSWNALDDVESLVVPDDLQEAFDQNDKAYRHWKNFPPSSKKIILEWILNAKRKETRQKRIEETVELAAENIRANHYRQPKGNRK